MTIQPLCANCRWWDRAAMNRAGASLCRARPPAMDFRSGEARWPCTDQGDWCAAHQFADAAHDGDMKERR